MKNTKAIESAANSVRKMWETHGIKEPMRFLGFCLSLLPIPVIQQSGMVLDRYLSDKKFNTELNDLWEEIKKINEKVSKVETLEHSINEIAKTIQLNSDLKNKTDIFLKSLGENQKEFTVLTENNSYQEVINSIVNADISSFIAKSGSTNIIEKTVINSNRTLLHATNNSKNFVDGSSFNGSKGSVAMQNITTQGHVEVQDSSVGFYGDSSIMFGSNPNELSGNCPNCNTLLSIDKRKLKNNIKIQCFNCKLAFPYSL